MKKSQMFEYNGYVFMEKMVIPYSQAMYQVIIPLWLDEKVKNTFSDKMLLSEIKLGFGTYIEKPARERIGLAIKKLRESDISLDDQSNDMRRNEILNAIHKDIIFDIGFSLFFNIITGHVISTGLSLISVTSEENGEYEVLITLYLEPISDFSGYMAKLSGEMPTTGRSIIQFKDGNEKYIANYGSMDTSESCMSHRWMRSSQIIVAGDSLLDKLIKMSREYKFEPLQNFCKVISIKEREMLLKDNPHLTNFLLKKNIPLFFSVSAEMCGIMDEGVSFVFSSTPSKIGNTEISLLTPNEINMMPTEDWINTRTLNVEEHDRLFTPYELMSAFYSEDKCLYSFLVGTIQTLITTDSFTGIRNMRVFGLKTSINETPMNNAYSDIPVYVTTCGEADEDGIGFSFPNPNVYKSHHAIIQDINNCYAYVPISFIPDEINKNMNSTEVVEYLKDALYERIPDEYQIVWDDTDIVFLGYRYEYAIFCIGLNFRKVNNRNVIKKSESSNNYGHSKNEYNTDKDNVAGEKYVIPFGGDYDGDEVI